MPHARHSGSVSLFCCEPTLEGLHETRARHSQTYPKSCEGTQLSEQQFAPEEHGAPEVPQYVVSSWQQVPSQVSPSEHDPPEQKP